MRFRTLRWLTVAIPLLFLALVDVLRHQVWPELLHPWPGFLVVLGIVAGAAWLFSGMVFGRAEAMERRIVEQNAMLRHAGETTRRQATQLEALHEAGLTLSAELALEVVLERIVNLARELTGARYGALAVVDEAGQIVRFLTQGLTDEERARLGQPPTGRGLLGQIFVDDLPIRVDEIARDPRSIGFPPGHPPMRTYLGVPIVLHGRRYGNLYLTDKQGAAGPISFTDEDERVVTLFAAQAAVAMENARLHGQVQALAAASERERIARELHDSLAQALGYVRLQAATARDALSQGQDALAAEALGQISEVAGDAYGEVREAILGLRSGGSGGERGLVDALGEYVRRYREQTGVDVAFDVGPGVAALKLAPAVEVQLVRIIQEAIANVRKHARTARARLTLDVVTGASGPRLRALVADDGQGFDLGQSHGEAHYGLAIMRERAEGVGGRLEIASALGRGTQVLVDMPIEAGPGTVAPGAIMPGAVVPGAGMEG
jgi:nitrate/nitrite-specific signal transduction histidine kinase